MTARRLLNIVSATALGGVLLAGCGATLPAPSGPAVLTTTPSTSHPTSDPVTPVATVAPVVTTTRTPAPATQPPDTTQQAAEDCGSDSYLNVDGACVHDPVRAPAAPPGATAQCKDGTYSFSKHHSGTCSGHHGVEQWL
ncbi:MAG TPA: DUF3761 domain-containing protein [Pseudonocardiaceae bacterium]|jgi:hypothetical protein|nr:DUF3761 domain-containing protein [Pseudonocardiaceae bacterium]